MVVCGLRPRTWLPAVDETFKRLAPLLISVRNHSGGDTVASVISPSSSPRSTVRLLRTIRSVATGTLERINASAYRIRVLAYRTTESDCERGLQTRQDVISIRYSISLVSSHSN